MVVSTSSLDGNIRTDTRTADELRKYEAERPMSLVRGRAEHPADRLRQPGRQGNGKYGQDTGTQRSDTTILLHLQAGRQQRDRRLHPARPDGGRPGLRPAGRDAGGRARFAQFNWAFEFGGAACTIRTVEKLTGIRVDHHVIVDFSGFKKHGERGRTAWRCA